MGSRHCSILRRIAMSFAQLLTKQDAIQPIPPDEDWVGLLTEDQRTLIVSEKTLYLVSEHIGAGFEGLGMKLDLSYACVERCVADHASSQLRILAILDTWRMKSGRHATVGNLVKTLQDSVQLCNIDMFEVISVVKKMQ